jgi:radical SAM family uncharacterized protein
LIDSASLDKILHRVTRPARYTGGEWNSIVKDWNETPIRFALSYPDVYDIGMSNMALPILYKLLNDQSDILAERVFAPWVDMAVEMRSAGIPLFSLESRRPLTDFDVIGFSLGYELTYTNVLNILNLAGIPLRSAERDDTSPLIIAGGSCALNPEPMADFIDLFVIGDGEEVLQELLDTFREWKQRGKTREQLLRQAAVIDGVYVPAFYRVDYQANGTVKSITPTVPKAKPTIKQRVVSKLPSPVTRPVVPYIEVTHDRGAIEIQRGCTRGCRFCQAGIIYRPVRERPLTEVIEAAETLVNECGYGKISLVSLSTSDYSGIDQLVTELSERLNNVTLSLPSLYINTFNTPLMDALSRRKKIGLTFAPEAGSERLRRIINKNITEDEILETFTDIFARSWTSIKLYFMLGLPEETTEDVEEIVRLVDKLRTLGISVAGRTPQLRINLSTFVPKPHTPFQWVAQVSEEELNVRHELLRAGLRRKGAKISWQDPETSLLEAALSRGDRRLGQVIRRAWELGSVFDAWDEHFKFENWQRSFEDSGLDINFYARRQRPFDELLPWGHIDIGVTSDFLKREYQRALEGIQTPDCREGPCSACGLELKESACHQPGA